MQIMRDLKLANGLHVVVYMIQKEINDEIEDLNYFKLVDQSEKAVFQFPWEGQSKIDLQYLENLFLNNSLLFIQREVKREDGGFLNTIKEKIIRFNVNTMETDSSLWSLSESDLEEVSISGIDVDPTGLFVLMVCYGMEYAEVRVYDNKAKSWIEFDNYDLCGAVMANPRWGNSLQKIQFFNERANRNLEITLDWERKKVIWDPIEL